MSSMMTHNPKKVWLQSINIYEVVEISCMGYKEYISSVMCFWKDIPYHHRKHIFDIIWKGDEDGRVEAEMGCSDDL